MLLLVAWEGLSAADAGAVLGIPGATVRTRLHRARGRLREALADPDDAPAIPPGDERNATLRRDTADELPLVRETEAQP